MIRTLFALAALLAPPAASAAPGHHHGPQEEQILTGPAAVLSDVLKPYFEVRQALLRDDLPEARKWAGMLMRSAKAHKQSELAQAAFAFKDATLPSARRAFLAVSALVIAAVEAFPPARATLKVFDCEAAPGRWLQVGSMPTNPYHSGELRTCGVEVPVSAAVAAAAAAQAAPASKPASHDHGDGKGPHAH